MQASESDTSGKGTSKRLKDSWRRNSKKFGHVAESIVLPKNKRSYRSRSVQDIKQVQNVDLERADSTDSLDPEKRYIPWLITLVVFIQVGVMILSHRNTWLSLCYDPFRRYELWRYLTVLLVHASVSHLIGNVLFELILGLTLETVHGWKRTIGIFLSGVIAGSLAVTIVTPKKYVVGASAGVYGLLTAHLVTLIFNWGQMERRVTRLVCLLTYIVLDVTVAYLAGPSNVSHAGHAGGAIGGLIAAAFFLRNFEVLEWESKFKKIVGVIGLLLFFTIVIVNIALPSSYYPSQFNFNYTDTYWKHVVSLFVKNENFDQERILCALNPDCATIFSDVNVTISTQSPL